MFSALDRRAGWSFSFRLVLRNAALFLLAAAAFYVVTRQLLAQALAEEWQERTATVQARWVASHTGVSREVSLHVRDAQVELSEALRAHVENRFRRTYLLLAIGLLVVGTAGGLVLTYLTTAPMRRIVRTVVDILETGDLGRRVPADRVRGTPAEIVAAFNRLLDRNAALVRAVHESLDNVAHDLRTPMTRLRATAERALARPDDADAAREAVADCLEESDRLLTMLNTLMEVAEAETGTMRLDRSRADLADVVRAVAELYALVAEERGATLETRVAAGVVADVDATRLRQAVANLVDNALKYGRAGNVVTVTLAREGGEAVLTVADRGPGIPPDELPRIWDRLYRGDRSRSERGLGLGLSLVRAVVAAHGGRVEAESAPGRGATFRIRLPATA